MKCGKEKEREERNLKKSTKKFKKGILVFLTIGMIMSSLPITHAQEQTKDNFSVGELVEKRELFSKQFQNEDGTITAVSYNYPIHYETSTGKMKDIDNTIINDVSYQPIGLSKQISKEQYYTSKDNPYIDVLFNKQTDSNNLIKINIDGYDISWGVSNLNNSIATPLNDNEKDSQYNLKNVTGGIKYANAFENADLYYYITSANLKEEIILNEKSNINQIIYNIETSLTPFKTEHNLVIFQNENGENIFSFQNPYMYDNAEKSSMTFDTTVDIQKTDSGYQLIYQLDTEWLNSEDRVYPIVIDPTVTNGRNQVSVLDTYVHPGDNVSHNHVNEDRLWIGNVHGTSRAFANWADLPTINGNINTAHISWNFFKGTSTWGPVSVYRVNSSWNSLTLTWDIHNTLSYTELASNIYPTLTNGYQGSSANITDTIKGWYNGTIAKNGFMIRYTNESYNDYNTIISSDSGSNSDFWPCLWINYIEAQPKPNAYVTSYYSSGVQSIATVYSSKLQGMNYNTTYAYNPTTSNIKQNIKSPVVVFTGHGIYNMMVFGQAGISKKTYDDTINCGTDEEGSRDRQMVGIGQFNLSSVNLMIFSGCLTSDNSHGNDYPIARMAIEYGAKSSIGWTHEIYINAQPSYMGHLMDGLASGKTVQGAIDYANSFSTTDPRVRDSYAWGNTSTTIKLSTSYNTQSANILKNVKPYTKEPVYYDLSNKKELSSYSSANKKSITIERYLKNINSNFDSNDYEVYETSNGKNIIYTYAPYGIKTSNIYNVILDDNSSIQGIYENVNNNFENLKEQFNKKTLLTDNARHDLINDFILNNNNLKNLNIYKSGYTYENNKVLFYIIYNYELDDTTIESQIEYYEI